MRKSNHKFISGTTEFQIDCATNYSFKSTNRMIINQSAIGNGATVYFNGTEVRTLPINAVLVAESFEELDLKKQQLQKLSDEGAVLEFITPYQPTYSNKHYISDISFEAKHGNQNWISFTCTLTEYREANVKTTAINLVNFASKEAFLEVYNNRIGQS